MSVDRELVIKVLMEDGQARASSQRRRTSMNSETEAAQRNFTAQERLADKQTARVSAAAERSATANEKASARATAASDRAAAVQEKAAKIVSDAIERETAKIASTGQREVDRQLKDSARMTAATEKAAKHAADSYEREMKRQSAIADKEATSQAKSALKASQSAERDVARQTAALERDAKKATAALEAEENRRAGRRKQFFTDEEIEQAVHNAKVRTANKSVVDDALAGDKQQSESMAALEASITRVVVAYLGFQGAERLVRAVASAMGEARNNAIEMAKQVMTTADELRALANLKGKSAPGDEVIAEHLDLRKQSGLTQREAIEFDTHFSSVPTIDEDKMSKDEQKKFKGLAAGFAARTGGATQARGSIAGLLPSFIKGQNLTAMHVQGVEFQNEDILKTANGENSELTKQYQMVLTKLATPDGKGMISTPQRAAALTALASISDTATSAQTTIEASRELRGFTKNRKQAGLSESQGQTLKKMGITEHDDEVGAMRKMFSHFDEDPQGGKAGRSFDTYLAEHGFRNQTGNLALQQFYNQYKTGNFDKVMAKADAPVPEAEAERFRQEFLASHTGKARVDDARVDEAKMQEGNKQLPLREAAKDAEPEFIKSDNDWKEVLKDKARGALTLGQVPGRDVKIEQEGLERLRKKAGEKRGSSWWDAIDPFNAAPGFSGHGLRDSMEALNGTNAEEAARLQAKIKGGMGGIIPGGDGNADGGANAALGGGAVADQLAKAIAENNRLMAENNQLLRGGRQMPPGQPPKRAMDRPLGPAPAQGVRRP